MPVVFLSIVGAVPLDELLQFLNEQLGSGRQIAGPLIDRGQRAAQRGLVDRKQGQLVRREERAAGAQLRDEGKSQSACRQVDGRGDIGGPEDTGQREIQPGDVVMGDRSGVVIVPWSRVDEVLAKAEELYEKEEAMVREILSSGDVLGVDSKFGYEKMLK